MKLRKYCFILFLFPTHGFQPQMDFNKARNSKLSIRNEGKKTKDRQVEDTITIDVDAFNISKIESTKSNRFKENTEKYLDNLDNLQFRFTFFDCILAIMFGGQWGPAFFWKDVRQNVRQNFRQNIEKIAIYPSVIVFFLFVIYNLQ